MRAAIGVETDQELWNVMFRDLIHESWTRHLLETMNLVFLDAGTRGVAWTPPGDCEDPGHLFFDRGVFLSRFEAEGLGDLARWWLSQPDRRQRLGMRGQQRRGGQVLRYPRVVDPAKVGTYSPLAGAGGGLVFDEVLEYRVWYKADDESVFRAFATMEEAEAFSKRDLPKIEPPLALVLQREHVDEPAPGKRILVRQQRVAEWSVGWLDDAHRRTPENLRRILGDMEAPRVAG